ncbi:glyoxalase [Wenjunlia vitaminophila]|uniref:Glyoxalase n=1 Tax=Wenjunlia vitaminophila TaxID=76728 RepID=A0A0T6LTL2_WENVI|nr:VOC family protein [Wenjunlia vitaminophila]KRV49348.1 glyoxalase [Wenjunlia vitaminophila]
MTLVLHQIAVDAHDVPGLARWWAEVLRYQILFEAEDEVVIGEDATTRPGLCFLPVPEGKTVKNRLHLDLAPDDQAAEVARLEGLGARRVGIGQGDDVTWVVLADPEGNEFCVLRPRRTLVD